MFFIVMVALGHVSAFQKCKKRPLLQSLSSNSEHDWMEQFKPGCRQGGHLLESYKLLVMSEALWNDNLVLRWYWRLPGLSGGGRSDRLPPCHSCQKAGRGLLSRPLLPPLPLGGEGGRGKERGETYIVQSVPASEWYSSVPINCSISPLSLSTVVSLLSVVDHCPFTVSCHC